LTDESFDIKNISKCQLFQIFLKTEHRRILLSIISGTIIFLILTGLVMIVYTYRFQAFLTYQEDKGDWYNNGQLSVSTNYRQTFRFTIEDGYFENITQEFLNLVSDIVPNIKVTSYTTAFSAEVYSFNSTIPRSPWLLQEIMTLDNRAYSVLADCLIDGRLPENKNELLWQKNSETDLALYDSVKIYGVPQLNSHPKIYTIVGIVDNVQNTFRQAELSTDVFNWHFESIGYSNYEGNNRYFTSLTLYQELFNDFSSYLGVLTYLLDAQYDLSELKLNSLTKYIKLFPTENNPAKSKCLGIKIWLCQDLKIFIAEFGTYWVLAVSKILLFNEPLFFIIGLISVVILNIGIKKMGTSFRIMKLYGLNYRIIRKMILLKNCICMIVSFVGGLAMGFTLCYLSTMNLDNRPSNYYLNFLTEPLLLIVIFTFILGFFGLSFITQNSIAKKTTINTSEEYTKKRKPILTLFSTNEFRLLVLTLIFAIFSVGLFLLYHFSSNTRNLATGITYLTFFYFMITCSISLIMTFIFLFIAKLTIQFWSFIGIHRWKKHLNIHTLSIKHISASKNSYKQVIFGSLIFGLVILPGFIMPSSIRENIKNEALIAIGASSLAILQWEDPDNERDGIFTNISEISYFTEVTVYEITEKNLEFDYPKAFNATVLALESPKNLTLVADRESLNQISSIEDILALEEDNSLLINKKYARKNHLKPGELFNTQNIARFPTDFTFINSYENFPLLPLPTKPLFTFQMDAFSIVGNSYTINQFLHNLDYSTIKKSYNVKIIKPMSESDIPIIKKKLQKQDIYAKTYDEIYHQMMLKIDVFSQSTLLIFAVLTFLVLIFTGYFTGLRIFEERGKIIEALYRVGAVRGQILKSFTFEFILINLLPMVLMILLSLPMIKFFAKYFLEYNNYYSQYRANVPGWIILIVIIGGLLITTIGWLFALMPAIYKFKPVKLE